MAAPPISIKLRCASWKQLAAIYERDLSRNAVFLKSAAPPPLGTRVRINLTLPTQTLIVLNGSVDRHVGAGELGGRGPGVDIKLQNVPQSALWLIESALESARRKGAMPAAPTSSDKDDKGGSAQDAPGDAGAAEAAPAGTASAEAASAEAASAEAASAEAPAAEPSAEAAPAETAPAEAVAAPAEAAAAEPAATEEPAEADMAAGEPLVEAEDELVAALGQELASLRKLNPFQILGVGYETSDDEVRAAFAALTKRYHPDRFARYESGEARRTAAEIFILIRNAYHSLDTAAMRAKAIEVLNKKRRAAAQAVPPPIPTSSPPPIPKAARPPPIPPATRAPVTPEPEAPAITPEPEAPAITLEPEAPAITLEPEAPAITLEPEAPAITLEPEAPAITLEPAPAPTPEPADTTTLSAADAEALSRDENARGYAHLDSGEIAEALRLFKLTTRRNASDRNARIGLELAEGLKALASRDRLEAAQRFEAVLELDPTNERAARELAEMRRQATNERKNLLTRLLNQKE